MERKAGFDRPLRFGKVMDYVRLGHAGLTYSLRPERLEIDIDSTEAICCFGVRDPRGELEFTIYFVKLRSNGQ